MRIIAALALAGCDVRPAAPEPGPSAAKPVPDFRFDSDEEYKALWDAKAPGLLRLPDRTPYLASESARAAYLEGYERAVRQVLAARGVDRITNFVPPTTEEAQALKDGYRDGQLKGFEVEGTIHRLVHERMIQKREEWDARGAPHK